MTGEMVTVVRLNGMVRDCDAMERKDLLEAQLGGKVIVVDDSIGDIFQLEPQDGGGTVTRREKAIHWALSAVALVLMAMSVLFGAAGAEADAADCAASACFALLTSLWLAAMRRAGL